MGQNLCEGNRQSHNIPQLVSNSKIQSPVKISPVEHVNHQPDSNFAVPFNEKIELPTPILNRQEELGHFYCPSRYFVQEGTAVRHMFQLNNGVKYIGQWKKGRMHGKGRFILPDRSIIDASVVENQIIFGRFIDCNGDYYEGEFKGNKAHGRGKYQEGHITYEGGFEDNLPSGEGVESGDKFKFAGRFEKGVKKYGKLLWIDDVGFNEYEGNFKDDLFQGKGSLKDKEETFIGRFEKGKLIE